MANYTTFIVHAKSISWATSNENGDHIHSGAEPARGGTRDHGVQAGIRATACALMFSARNGGIAGYEIIDGD